MGVILVVLRALVHPVWTVRVFVAWGQYFRRYGVPIMPMDEGRKEHVENFMREKGLID